VGEPDQGHITAAKQPTNIVRAILVSRDYTKLKESVMANKEQRGNREKKKQKKDKPKPSAQTSSFSQSTYGSKRAAGKKS
jgi:hypothetical protein